MNKQSKRNINFLKFVEPNIGILRELAYYLNKGQKCYITSPLIGNKTMEFKLVDVKEKE